MINAVQTTNMGKQAFDSMPLVSGYQHILNASSKFVKERFAEAKTGEGEKGMLGYKESRGTTVTEGQSWRCISFRPNTIVIGRLSDVGAIFGR